MQLIRSVGWVCPVCEINTKDALSDTPPDIEVKREELPNFMITYKSTTTDKEDSSLFQEPSGSSKEKVRPCTDNIKPLATSVANSDELLNSQSNGPNDRILTETQPENEPTTSADITSQATEPPNIATIRTESSGSPIWLDALIAGLVSFICVLVCRKYIYPF